MKPLGRGIARLRNRTKLAIGTRILDIAEMLPSFNGGFVKRLQEMRHNARRQVDEDFKNTRLPDGGRLELPQILMFQVYPIEDIDILTRAMENTFGNDKFRFSADSLENVKKSESKLWAGSWTFLGHLSRDKSSFFYPRGHKYIHKLPIEISKIGIELYHVFPSTFVILFRVSLTSQVGETLNVLHNRRYLGEIEFRHFLPLGKWAYGSSHGDGDSVRAKKISTYLDVVSLSAERQIRALFPGSRVSGKRRLPILRDLRLMLPVGADASFNDGVIFRAGCSVGLRSLSFDAFRDGNSAFSLSSEKDAEGDSEKFWTLFTIKSGPLSDDEDRVLGNKAASLIPMLAIRNLLDQVAEEVGLLRVKAYRRVLRSGKLRDFHRDLRLYARLQVQKFIADRIQTERKTDPHAFSLWAAEISKFEHNRVAGRNLFSVLTNGFDGMEALIYQHSQLVMGLFQGYVEARNLEVSYRLSRRVLVWTIIVTIVTVVSCLATYDQSLKQFGKIRDFVERYVITVGSARP